MCSHFFKSEETETAFLRAYEACFADSVELTMFRTKSVGKDRTYVSCPMECFDKRHGFVNTGGPPYSRVIRFKTYRGYGKPRIITNAIYIQSVTGGKDQTSGGCSLC